MRIFLSNDDGINAPNLKITVEHLSKIAEVYVAVPETEHSSAGHGLSPHNPLWVREVELPGATKAWAVAGRPADCVKLAMAELLPVKPDLVVGGINPTPNLATEVQYSGTVTVAIEGYMHGLPSIAMSQAYRRCDTHEAAKCLVDVIKRWEKVGFSPLTMLNVNYPDLPFDQVKGYRYARQGWRWYGDAFETMHDPNGRMFYWLHCKNMVDGTERDTDLAAIDDGYVSITPLTFDATDYAMMAQMQQNDPFADK